jgi:hypothetical protein
VTSTGSKPKGGGSAGRRTVAVGGKPLEGAKAQGRIGPDPGACVGTATDFRGGQSLEGGRGFASSSVAKPFEPTPSGLVRPEGADRAAEGETFEGRNPKSVIGLKQGRRGFGRNKASGGWKTPEAQLNRVRQPRDSRFPIPQALKGTEPWRGVGRREALHKLGTVTLRRGAKVQEGPATFSNGFVAAADAGRPPANRVIPVQVRGKRRTHTGATVIRGNP